MIEHEPCEHEWKYFRDCEGDAGVVNGLNYFWVRQCELCGVEEQGVEAPELEWEADDPCGVDEADYDHPEMYSF